MENAVQDRAIIRLLYDKVLPTAQYHMYKRKNNRGKIQIMGEVLAVATSGIRKTRVMYKANLSYEQVHFYLAELIEKRLIAQDVSSPDGVVYRTTTKGREFLLYYTRLVEFLEEEKQKQSEVQLSAPYVSGKQSHVSSKGRCIHTSNFSIDQKDY